MQAVRWRAGNPTERDQSMQAVPCSTRDSQAGSEAPARGRGVTPHTQTVTGERGNCWQTAIASVLEIDPRTMPDQSAFEYYQEPLKNYLRDHHELAYVELWPPGLASVISVKAPGWHFLCGPTERRTADGRTLAHVVVARYGEMVWDPHPSRAGLTVAERMGVLMPFPKEWRGSRPPCVCPACAA